MSQDNHGLTGAEIRQEKTRLFEAINRDDANEIRAIFAQPGVAISPDERDQTGRSALSLAAGGASTACVLALLDAGASVNPSANHTDGKHVTALNAALSNSNVDTAILLLSHGADPRIRNREGSTALHLAVTEAVKTSEDHNLVGKIAEIAQICIKAGVSLNQPDVEGDTPLLIASLSHRENPIIGTLLEHGANPNLANNRGRRPIHRWWTATNICNLKCLAAAGADLRAMNFEGESVWEHAGDVVAAEAMHDLGADINLLDYDGRNVILAAAKHPNWAGLSVEVLTHLIACGADLDAPDFGGETARQCIERRAEEDSADTPATALLAAINAMNARLAMRVNWTKRPASSRIE